MYKCINKLDNEAKILHLIFLLDNEAMILHFIFNQDYQFWTRTDEMGCFSINNIRPGDYNLYAWVPGFLGDYKSDALVTITSGLSSRLVVDGNFLCMLSKQFMVGFV